MSANFQAAKMLRLPETALDALPHGVLLTEADATGYRVIYGNAALESITGYTPSEFLGRNCRFLQGPDTDARAIAEIHEALHQERECCVLLKNHRKDGQAFWNELSIAPVRDGEGQLTHFIGLLADVTSRVEADAARNKAFQRLETAYARERRIAETLQENDLQLADLLESLTEGFFALDGHWRLTYLNHQAEPLLGGTRETLLGQTLWDAFPALIGAPLERELRHAAEGRMAVEIAEFFPPQETWWDVRAYPAAEGLTVFVRDVTAHQRAERERREMQSRQRSFVRDVLASVTGGKLHLCYSAAELPLPLTPAGEPIVVQRTDSLGDLRHLADQAARAVGLSEDQRCELALSVGEAAMNAVVHAGEGVGRVSVRDAQTVQVRIEDHGRGITVENLPKATLERGYTTAGTMGHGMKIMLQALDRLWLLTGPAGTTVVMEKDRVPPEPDWLQERFDAEKTT